MSSNFENMPAVCEFVRRDETRRDRPREICPQFAASASNRFLAKTKSNTLEMTSATWINVCLMGFRRINAHFIIEFATVTHPLCYIHIYTYTYIYRHIWAEYSYTNIFNMHDNNDDNNNHWCIWQSVVLSINTLFSLLPMYIHEWIVCVCNSNNDILIVDAAG